MSSFPDDPHQPPPIELPPSRLPGPAAGVPGDARRPRSSAAGGGRAAGGGGVRRVGGGGGGGGRGGRGPGGGRNARPILLVGGVIVALMVIAGVLAAGPFRSKLRSVFGTKATTTTQPRPIAVSIPEGFRQAQILFRLHQDVSRLDATKMHQLLASGQITSTLLPPGGVPASALPPNGSAMEGLLFPATYAIPPGSDELHTLTLLAAKMEDETTSLGITAAAARLGYTPYQIVTVASMVQTEAGNPDEAPKVARVIYNRLQKKQPLGIDATLRYLQCARVTSGDCPAPTVADITDLKHDPSLFNTYGHTGLPPTPIGAPGEYALQAAMNPADGFWLFYVRDTANDAQGRPQHLFFDTNTGADYKAAVKACQQANLGC